MGARRHTARTPVLLAGACALVAVLAVLAARIDRAGTVGHHRHAVAAISAPALDKFGGGVRLDPTAALVAIAALVVVGFAARRPADSSRSALLSTADSRRARGPPRQAP